MRMVLLLGLVMLLSSCGSGDAPTGSASSSCSRDAENKSVDGPCNGNDETAPKETGTATSLPELFVDGWYRAPGGVAIVQFPELPKGWTLKYGEGQSGRLVTLATPGASAVFTFLPLNAVDAVDLKLAQALATAVAQSVLKELPQMKLTRTADELKHDGGFCSARFLEGKNDQNIEMSCIVAAVAEGKEAALCMCLARKNLLDSAWNQLAAKVLEGVKVGKRVPRLTAHDPGTALSGVYQGPTDFGATARDNVEYWMVFDQRGWCHEYSPDSEQYLELDAMYQWKPERCLRYRLQDGKLELLTADGTPKKSFKCEVQKDKLVLDGKNWRNLTQTEPEVLEGHYEAFSFYVNSGYGSTFTFSSSQNFWFTKDGRFSFESSTMATTTDDSGWPPSDGFRDWAHAYAETPKNFGHYRIVKNILQLKFADGRRASKTIFVHKGVDAGMLHIDGNVYLENK